MNSSCAYAQLQKQAALDALLDTKNKVMGKIKKAISSEINETSTEEQRRERRDRALANLTECR